MTNSHSQSLRLVSFLGIGEYKETTYKWREQTFCTRFVAHTLAEILKPTEVLILGTSKSWDKHGDAITQHLGQYGVVRPTDDACLPPGASPNELWQQFEMIKQVLRGSAETRVILDITHGFRSQPFFASAAAAFVRAVDPVTPELQVVYGAFDAQQDNVTPIWDVTPFVELVDWSHSLMLFLKTGRVASVAADTRRLGRSLQKAWHLQGQIGEQPTLDKLGQALDAFGLDLETVRTGSILLGRGNQTSSAQALLNELTRSGPQVAATIPPLADVLIRIQEMVQVLVTTERLSQSVGQRALFELGTLYWNMGRFSEAASTMREAWITRYSCDKSDCPGMSSFSKEHREAAEKAWFEANELLSKEIGELRNDINHAGYRDQPMPPATIKKRIKELLDQLIPDDDKSE